MNTKFRAETLALINEQDYTVQEAASALGKTTSLLCSWKQKVEEHANSTLNSDERAELLALRKEVKTLRIEKEILKKASAFFAK
jgi:transposase